MIHVRELDCGALARLAEIDRSELIGRWYRVASGKLQSEQVVWNVPRWSDEQITEFVTKLTPELEAGGIVFGAEENSHLIGVAVLGNRPLGPGDELLQLVFLHVSRKHRRRGIATLLVDAAAATARQRGARGLYISATASESALGFYMRRGAVLLDEPDPQLLAQEPEDIHLAEFFS